ncbi:MAG: DUF3224 family protein [Acidobacteria bacterium]|nr:DUF3224 family protein [Acidobacteriota bacterium]
MNATGTFDVQLTPQEDRDAPAGRMLIDKTYDGDAVGAGRGQMLSKRTEAGTAAYCAVEEFVGALDGREGGFTLVHNGRMSAEAQSLDVLILEGSGTGELAGITGSMRILQDDAGHRYELDYAI